MDELDRRCLQLEAEWFRYAGAKDQAIRDLGLSPVRYYQRILAVIDEPHAQAEFPTVIARLHRQLAARTYRAA